MVPSADDITRKPLHPPIYQETERDPLRRRFWLLWQALKYGSSMAEALKIAEEIEAFLVVGAASCSSHDTPNKVAAAPLEAPHGKPREMPQAVPSLLNPENKAELSARLEACNSNAQLAVEFGLTPRQVQGFRMQVGRRAKSKIAAVNPQRQAATSAPGIEEVVRYLRQQGDVVVANGPGMFLLNGLFRLDVDQLKHRANRMRQHQRKPEFRIGERPTADREAGSVPRLPALIGR